MGELACSVHTTSESVTLIAYWRSCNDSSDPKNSPSEGVEKEDPTKDTSDGSIEPNKATSSVGIVSSALYSAEFTAGGVATEDNTNWTNAMAILMLGMDFRNWRITWFRWFAVPYCSGFGLNESDEDGGAGLVRGLRYSPLYRTAREAMARWSATPCRDAFFVES